MWTGKAAHDFLSKGVSMTVTTEDFLHAFGHLFLVTSGSLGTAYASIFAGRRVQFYTPSIVDKALGAAGGFGCGTTTEYPDRGIDRKVGGMIRDMSARKRSIITDIHT